MKVICIDDSNLDPGTLTNGKIYSVIENGKILQHVKFHLVVNDFGNRHRFLKTRFESIEDRRNKKIDGILS